MFEECGEGEEEEGLEECVGADFAQAEFALRGDDEDGNCEVAEEVAVEKEGSGGWGCSGCLAEIAELDEGFGEGDGGEHPKEEDAEVDHVVGVKLGVARGVED